MKQYKINFLTDRGETKSVVVEAHNNVLGRLWSDLMEQTIDHPLRQTDRIYGLNDKWSIKGIFETLREMHDTFEMYDYTLIDHEFDFDNVDYTDMDAVQDMLNKLHEIFVAVMDTRKPGVNQGKAAEAKHPQFIIDMAQEFNILIHRCEGLKTETQQVVVSFEDKIRHDLYAMHIEKFTNIIKAGDVVFKYLGTGKKLYEAFKDNDVDAIANKHIVPQFDVAADFIIKFKDAGDEESDQAFTEWLIKHKRALNAIRIYPSDPLTCRNHFGVVGRVVGDLDKVKKDLFGITEIKSIERC